MPEHWLLSVDDRIATLTLNRAAHKNTITSEVLFELRDLTAEIRANRKIWAVILRADGEHFSVGVDVHYIAEVLDSDETAFRANLRSLQACLDEFEALPKPTIASIRGYCIGGGALLALCCDFRIASQTTRISFPEVRRGIAVIMGTQRITRIAGLARAKELTMLGDSISAEQAHQYGLVTRVVTDDALETVTAQFAAQFRDLPPRTVAICKRIADEGYALSLRESQDLEIRLQAGLLTSKDLKEGIASFFEKRPPQFTGE